MLQTIENNFLSVHTALDSFSRSARSQCPRSSHLAIHNFQTQTERCYWTMQRPRHFCSVEMVGADKPLILGEPTHWPQGHHCVSASLLTQPPQRYTAKWVAMKSHLLLALKVSPGLQLIVQLAEKRTNMRVSLQSTPSSSPAPLLLFLSLLASQQHDRCSETRHIRPV